MNYICPVCKYFYCRSDSELGCCLDACVAVSNHKWFRYCNYCTPLHLTGLHEICFWTHIISFFHVISFSMPISKSYSSLCILLILTLAVFYMLHRLWHHPLMYAMFHKKHHEFKAPFAWSAEHASLTELLIVDISPVWARVNWK